LVDTKPLLKGFGAAAGVARQIATDKAVNSRRLSRVSSDIAQEERERLVAFDVTDGQLIEDYLLDGTAPETRYTDVPHALGRTPKGAWVLKVVDPGTSLTANCQCVAVTATIVRMQHAENTVVTIWVV